MVWSALARINRLGLLAIAAAATTGCATAPGATLPQLQVRASYDLVCPPQYLTLQHLDRRTKLVGGCGNQEIYVEICDDIRGKPECTWLLNSARSIVAFVRQRGLAAPNPVGPQFYQNPGPRPEPPVVWPSPELPFPEEWDKPKSPEYLPPAL